MNQELLNSTPTTTQEQGLAETSAEPPEGLVETASELRTKASNIRADHKNPTMLPEKRYRLADMVDATARNLEHQAAGQLVGRARDNIEQANQRLISAANTRGSGVTTRQKRNEVAGMLSQNALEHGLQATDQLTQATRLVQAGAGKHEQTERASSPAANTRDSVAA